MPAVVFHLARVSAQPLVSCKNIQAIHVSAFHSSYDCIVAIVSFPHFVNLPGYVRQPIDKLVHLEWTIAGNDQYVDPYIIVNGSVDLTNITNNFVLYKKNPYYPPREAFDVILDLHPTDFRLGTHQFHLCVPFSSQVEHAGDYNNNPNCSHAIVTLIKPGMKL